MPVTMSVQRYYGRHSFISATYFDAGSDDDDDLMLNAALDTEAYAFEKSSKRLKSRSRGKRLSDRRSSDSSFDVPVTKVTA